MDVLGRYPQQSIHEAWTSAAAKAIRERFQQNLLADGCSTCAMLLHIGEYDSVPIKAFDLLMPGKRIPAFYPSKDKIHSLPKIFVFGTMDNAHDLVYDESFQLQLRAFLPTLKVLKFETVDALQIPLYKSICTEVLSLQPKMQVHLKASDFVPAEEDKALLSGLNIEWTVSSDRFFVSDTRSNQLVLDEKRLKASLTRFRETIQNKHLHCQLEMRVTAQNIHLISEVFAFCIREQLGFQWLITDEDDQQLKLLSRETLKNTFRQLEASFKKLREGYSISEKLSQRLMTLIERIRQFWAETFRTKRFTDTPVTQQTNGFEHLQFDFSSFLPEKLEFLAAVLKQDAAKGDVSAQQMLSMMPHGYNNLVLSDLQSQISYQAFNRRFLDALAFLNEQSSEREVRSFSNKLEKIDATFNNDEFAEKLTTLFTSTPLLTQVYHIKRLKEDQLLKSMRESLS